MPQHSRTQFASIACVLTLCFGAAAAWQTAPASAQTSLKGHNLSGRDYAGRKLDGVDFTGATIRGANLRGASLKGANLTGADLTGADLAGADLTGAIYDATTKWPRGFAPPGGAAAAPATQPSRQTAARAAGKSLRGRDFASKDLKFEGFDQADLEGANFNKAQLNNASLKGANLRNARLSQANLNDADLSGADLTGADLTGATLINAKLIGAKLPEQLLFLAGAAIHLEGIKELPYEIRQFAKPDLRNGTLSFNGADMRNTRIFGNLDGVDFRRADLRGADLSKADNLDSRFFRGAVYDRRTRWGIDPVQSGAQRGDDVAIAPRWFTGAWAIDQRRENGEAEPAKIGLLKILADGTYTWDPGEGQGELTTGRWQPLAPTTGPNGSGLRLSNGEFGLDWIVAVQDSGDIVLTSADGRRVRYCFRS